MCTLAASYTCTVCTMKAIVYVVGLSCTVSAVLAGSAGGIVCSTVCAYVWVMFVCKCVACVYYRYQLCFWLLALMGCLNIPTYMYNTALYGAECEKIALKTQTHDKNQFLAASQHSEVYVPTYVCMLNKTFDCM